MPKVLKDRADASAGFVAGSNAVRMAATKENFVLATEHGVTISGPMSLANGLDHIRARGFWVFNSHLNLSLPSTYATPNATLEINPPVGQFKNLMQDAVVMMGLMGAVAAIGAAG